MHILKRVLVGISASLLASILLTFGFFWSLHQVIGTPGPVKTVLRQSGLYESGVGAALDQAQKDQKNDTNENKDNIPVNQPQVRTIIEQAFPPSFLQTQIEQVIDHTYAWLNGKDAQLAFSIDFTSAKAQLASGMGSYAEQRLNTLPVCTAVDTSLPANDIDPFTAACRPAGFDVHAASTKVQDNIQNGDFLKDTKIDANSLKNDQGKSLNDQLKAVPHAYQRAIMAMYTAGVLALGLAAVVIFLSVERRTGIRRVAIIAISTGAISTLLAWLGSWGVHRAAIEFTKTQSAAQPLQQKVIRAVELLTSDLRAWWMGYGILLLVLGIAALVSLHFLKPNAAEQAEVLARAPEPVKTEGSKKPARKGIKPNLPELKD